MFTDNVPYSTKLLQFTTNLLTIIILADLPVILSSNPQNSPVKVCAINYIFGLHANTVVWPRSV